MTIKEKREMVIKALVSMPNCRVGLGDTWCTILDILDVLKAQEPKPRESRKMLPCTCGGKRRQHWFSEAGYQMRCVRCGLAAPRGKTELEAIRAWNKMIEEHREKV